MTALNFNHILILRFSNRINPLSEPVKMNSVRFLTVMILCLFAAIESNAGKVYTWTDERGVTHITETPPPPNAKNRDVIEYVPKTKEEEATIRKNQLQLQKEDKKEQIVSDARNSRRRANEARAKATELKSVADQLFQQSETFKTKTSNTIRRWQKNKATRLKLEKEAAEAQKQAQAADQEAKQLERRAQEAEKRVKEMLAEEERLAADEAAPAAQ